MPARINETIQERLDRHSIPEPNSGCILWTATVGSHGYGIFSYGGRPGFTAHRASYEANKGPIPPGMHVCHKCDVPSCINPDHLFVGTARDNMRDMFAKGRRRARALRGEESRFAKITEDRVRAILAAAGSHGQVASRYGVSKSLVSQIRRRVIWKHVQ